MSHRQLMASDSTCCHNRMRELVDLDGRGPLTEVGFHSDIEQIPLHQVLPCDTPDECRPKGPPEPAVERHDQALESNLPEADYRFNLKPNE